MNKFKYETVTDMSIGQVVDAIVNGEVFYRKSKKLSLSDYAGMSEFCGIVFVDLFTLSQELKNGSIQRKIEVHWTEQLDGTYDNGVWCKVGMTKDYSGISKVVALEETYPKYKTLRNHYAAYAEPVSEELAELLEKEMK